MNVNITYLWLDDIRPSGAGIYELHNFDCCVAHSVNEAKKIIQEAEKDGQNRFILDLDHDLGDFAFDGGDGYELVKWLIETERNTKNYVVQCHSMNIVGYKNICSLRDRYFPPFDEKYFLELMKMNDLTGQKFGRLKVLRQGESYRTPNGRNHITWVCQCECGTIKTIRGDSLKNGHTVSCGCKKKEILLNQGVKQKIDLSNKKFGDLLVLSDSKERSNHGEVKWLCKCSCGNIIKVIGTNLTKLNGTTSCGCKKSKGEQIISNILRENNIVFEKEYYFEDLLTPNGDFLRFDFKIGNNLIEYQGIQHYKPIEFFGGEEQFKIQQEYNEMKRQYCKENNFNLIEIPYYDIDKIDYLYLRKKMNNGKKDN